MNGGQASAIVGAEIMGGPSCQVPVLVLDPAPPVIGFAANPVLDGIVTAEEVAGCIVVGVCGGERGCTIGTMEGGSGRNLPLFAFSVPNVECN